MDSRKDKKRTKLEDDRLSNLPDDLIYKICSFIDAKHVVQTSVLSSRWRFIWTSTPYLSFLTEDIPMCPKYNVFVTHVLSCRNKLGDVVSINLRYHGKVNNNACYKKIMKYVVSHNIQQLNIVCVANKKIECPIFLFSSRTLKHLSLKKEPNEKFSDLCFITAMSTWELPALTSLYLENVTFCCDENTDEGNGLFSKCANLKNLILKGCNGYKSTSLSISHPLLSTLTIEDSYSFNRSWEKLNVVAPQLKNLTLHNRNQWENQYLISAPDLESLVYKGNYPLRLSTKGFHALEKAEICVLKRKAADARGIVRMLEQLHSVKFLSLNLEIVELLSSSAVVLSNHPSPFANLKSLKIHLVDKFSQKNKKISVKVKNYLLGISPNATLTMVSREDIGATENTKNVHKVMEELQVILERGRKSRPKPTEHQWR